MEKRLRQPAMIQLSLKYGFVTQWTSFVAVEERQKDEKIERMASIDDLVSKVDVDVLPTIGLWEDITLQKEIFLEKMLVDHTEIQLRSFNELCEPDEMDDADFWDEDECEEEKSIQCDDVLLFEQGLSAPRSTEFDGVVQISRRQVAPAFDDIQDLPDVNFFEQMVSQKESLPDFPQGRSDFHDNFGFGQAQDQSDLFAGDIEPCSDVLPPPNARGNLLNQVRSRRRAAPLTPSPSASLSASSHSSIPPCAPPPCASPFSSPPPPPAQPFSAIPPPPGRRFSASKLAGFMPDEVLHPTRESFGIVDACALQPEMERRRSDKLRTKEESVVRERIRAIEAATRKAKEVEMHKEMTEESRVSKKKSKKKVRSKKKKKANS